MMLLKHPDWLAAKSIIEKLAAAGYTAYLAGGCVRDALLSKVAKDLDIATNARAERVQELFPDHLPIGKEFGVILVKEMDSAIEVTTFRSDGPYLDGRHPSSVTFTTANEDAERRDFTVNALFYDVLEKKVIDYVGGVKDLENKILRAVGQAGQRFEEDRLRVLRAIRFAAQLNFALDPHLENCVGIYSKKLGNLSKERVTTEIQKIIQAPYRNRGLALLRSSGCWSAIWPEIQFIKEKPFFEKLLEKPMPDSDQILLPVFIATLFHMQMSEGQDSEALFESLTRFTFSKRTVEQVRFCIEKLPELLKGSTESLLLLDHPYGLALFAFAAAVLNGDQKKSVDVTRQTYLRLVDSSGTLPANLIDGNDLKNLGIAAGPIYKKILHEVYLLQLEGKIRSKEQALEWVSSFW